MGGWVLKARSGDIIPTCLLVGPEFWRIILVFERTGLAIGTLFKIKFDGVVGKCFYCRGCRESWGAKLAAWTGEYWA